MDPNQFFKKKKKKINIQITQRFKRAAANKYF